MMKTIVNHARINAWFTPHCLYFRVSSISAMIGINKGKIQKTGFTAINPAEIAVPIFITLQGIKRAKIRAGKIGTLTAVSRAVCATSSI